MGGPRGRDAVQSRHGRGGAERLERHDRDRERRPGVSRRRSALQQAIACQRRCPPRARRARHTERRVVLATRPGHSRRIAFGAPPLPGRAAVPGRSRVLPLAFTVQQGPDTKEPPPEAAARARGRARRARLLGCSAVAPRVAGYVTAHGGRESALGFGRRGSRRAGAVGAAPCRAVQAALGGRRD